MPCMRTSRFALNSRVIHLLHSPSASPMLWPPISIVARRSGRFQWIVTGSRISSRAVSPASSARSASESDGPFARILRCRALMIGFCGPTSSVLATPLSITRRFRMPPISVLPSSYRDRSVAK